LSFFHFFEILVFGHSEFYFLKKIPQIADFNFLIILNFD